ncbi:hypothetical protein dqs_2001 [Azoarcus olearius]|uniref:hypothetical protein n=1 Tax=Azoarcus sp. (strain BH72) TaxID=418699 RepID=UPI00080626E8|nr:hypothetical protein [Azoarcus olearius]ANQ85039.1 hypothetical protein dqs_2001 [Azoarcus olearius]
MPRKPSLEERKLILMRDQRRKYGARLVFQVQRAHHIGELENVTLLIDDGTLATIGPERVLEWEGGKRYHVEVNGFPTASEAEDAGMRTAQALLLTAVSLNFGLRLNYHSHEPPTVFDRTISTGLSGWGEGFASWPQNVVLDELTKALKVPLKDRRLLLCMELFVAAALESNDRARFVMAVSALEPLAAQADLGPEVARIIDGLSEQLSREVNLPADLRNSLQGRLLQLKRESVRQALKRLCAQWLPNDREAWRRIDKAYALRSEMLHEGRPSDLDILLREETNTVSSLLRRIYQKTFDFPLRAAIAA